MQTKTYFAALALLPLISLASCGSNNSEQGIISYRLEAKTNNVKLDYYVGETFDPTNLVVNVIKLVNGEITSITPTQDYTFNIELDQKLTKEVSEIIVYSTIENVLPYKFNITVSNPIFGIGEQQNLNELYPGYTFTSSDGMIGHVNPKGILETYCEGEFSLVGTKPNEKNIYIDCVVDVDDSIDYKVDLNKGDLHGFYGDFLFDNAILANEEYPLDFTSKYAKQSELVYEFTNNETGTIKINEVTHEASLLTHKPGDGRLKIYKNEIAKENLLFDEYIRVVTPYDPNELPSLLAGSFWTTTLTQFNTLAINFNDTTRLTIAGISSKPVQFTYKLSQKPFVYYDTTKMISFDLESSDQSVKIQELHINSTGGFIHIYDDVSLYGTPFTLSI